MISCELGVTISKCCYELFTAAVYWGYGFKVYHYLLIMQLFVIILFLRLLKVVDEPDFLLVSLF